jgi:5'(3')-deoxyribonucleotidase
MANPIFLDLDGVFADFDKARLSLTDKRGNEIWPIIDKIPEFFRNLEVLPDSLKLVTMLQHHRLEFLTALPEPTGYLDTAREDKIWWVSNHISRKIKVNTIIGGKNKILWLETYPGALLIDDYKRNIDLWNAHGGVGILHTSVNETLNQLERLGYL